MDLTNVSKLTEKFSKEFQELLNPDNTFYLNSDGVTGSDITVNIPQFDTEIAAGAASGELSVVDWVEANKQVTAQRFRTKAYSVDDWTNFFTAPDMRANALRAMKGFMDTQVGNFAAYKLASTSAGTQVATTDTATRTSSVTGSTATVKRISETDMINVQEKMNASNIYGGQWVGLLNAAQIGDLMRIANFTTADKMGVQSRLLSGQFAEILGIKVFQRTPSLGANVAYSEVGTPGVQTLANIYSVPGATADAVATDMTGAAIFWNTAATYTNKGYVKSWAVASATRQADLLSSQYSFGMDKKRADEAGVVTLIETVA